VSRDELERRFALRPGVALAVLPARFSEQKNHRDLVSAMKAARATLKDRSPEILCVGDGPLRSQIEQEASVIGGDPLVRCVDHDAGAAGWMAAADFFVLPSRWGGPASRGPRSAARGAARRHLVSPRRQ
jgi:glycosyltransferase involved in cell wall biosynthesis